MAMLPAARLARPRWWPAVVPWTLWALVVVALALVPWLDRLLRQAGRPDLTQWDVRPGLAVVSAATIGAVLASRRPRHPVGWLLLAQAISGPPPGLPRSTWPGGCWPVPGRRRPPASWR